VKDVYVVDRGLTTWSETPSGTSRILRTLSWLL
jgi:hypothetical protein